jgi:hypothetical protein
VPSSYLLKLERARDHLKALQLKEREFFKNTPASIDGEYSEDHSTYTFRFHVHRQPPASFSLIIGDFLTNLMAALDHLVYELSSVKSERIGFPISNSLENFGAEVRGQKLVGLKKSAIETVQEWQPFSKSPQNPESDLLWLLKTLGNWDKHRTLHLTVAHPRTVSYSPWLIGDLMELMVKPSPVGPFKDGTETATFQIPEQYRDRKTPIVATLDAGFLFDEAAPSTTGDRWWVVLLLQRLLDYADDRVLPALARHLPGPER